MTYWWYASSTNFIISILYLYYFLTCLLALISRHDDYRHFLAFDYYQPNIFFSCAWLAAKFLFQLSQSFRLLYFAIIASVWISQFQLLPLFVSTVIYRLLFIDDKGWIGCFQAFSQLCADAEYSAFSPLLPPRLPDHRRFITPRIYWFKQLPPYFKIAIILLFHIDYMIGLMLIFSYISFIDCDWFTFYWHFDFHVPAKACHFSAKIPAPKSAALLHEKQHTHQTHRFESYCLPLFFFFIGHLPLPFRVL